MNFKRLFNISICLFGLGLGTSQIAYSQVVAEFSADTTRGCGSFPLLVTFENLTTGGATEWLWDFGDPLNGNTSNLENPRYAYTEPGCYDVSLVAINGADTSRITKTCFIELTELPTPDFTVSSQQGCAPLTVQFTDASTSNGGGAITSYFWNFTDGSFSNEASPTITFQDTGSIGVILRVDNANGCFNFINLEDVVQVSAPPELEFEADPVAACSGPLDVTFTNLTNPNGATNPEYIWSFPGASPNSSNLETPPIISYPDSGSYDVTLFLNSVNGCRDTLTKTNYIGIGGVTANFTSNVTQICLGDTVTFENTSTGGVNSITWLFGDGTTSDLDIPNHVYTAAGQYTVTLQANNPDGCGDTLIATNYITVLPNPEADFSPDRFIDCQTPATFSFTDESISPFSWSWDFGDGTTSTVQNPTKTYNAFGDYTVCLTVTAANACADTYCHDTTISVNPPTPNYSVNNSDGCTPSDAQFTDQSISPSDSIISWNWAFTGATPATSTDQNPFVTFDTPGTQTVTLIIETTQGCRDTLVRSDIRRGTPPEFDFGISDTLVCKIDTVGFNVFSTNPAQDTTDWKYRWDFMYMGDSINVMSDEANPVHNYTDTTGYFNVALMIDYNGCLDTVIVDSAVFVQPPIARFSMGDTAICSLPQDIDLTDEAIGPVDIYEWLLDGNQFFGGADPGGVTINTPGQHLITQIVTNISTGCTDTLTQQIQSGSPLASFNISSTTECRPFAPLFQNTSTDASAYLWLIGDTITSTDFVPSIVLPDTGIFDVTLIAADNFGCVDTVSNPDLLTVIGPYAAFEADTLTGCPPLAVEFRDLSVTSSLSSIASRLWNFDDPASGDDSTSTATSPTHAFNSSGDYNISLTVIDNQGCGDTETLPAYVRVTFPVPDFSISDDSTCAGAQIDFTNLSQGENLSYTWDFGDGSPLSNLQDPVHSFDSVGTYSVKLIAVDVNGCVDSTTRIVVIEDFFAEFDGAPRARFCPPLETIFTNQSQGNISDYSWQFGDGLPSDLENPAHIYLIPGNFDVTLTVTHEDGCTDEITKESFIEVDGPLGDFVVDPPEICLGDTLNLSLFTEKACQITVDYRDGFFEDFFPACGIGVPDTTLTSYVYTRADTFDINLFLLDQGGSCPVQRTVTAIVHPNPTVAFSPIDTLGCAPFDVPFQDLSIVQDTVPQSWLWNFGNGDTSTVRDPLYTFNDPGTFTVSLQVTDSLGCIDSLSQTVQVNPGIVADFAATDSFGCAPFATDFLDQSREEAAVNWSWDFGDGGSSTLQNPNHTYGQDGAFSVKLVVNSALGCTDSLTKINYINLSRPTAQVAVSDTVGCGPVSFTLFGTGSQSDTLIASYEWCITEITSGFTACFPSIGTADSLEYEFTNPGLFDVATRVTDVFGCSDTSNAVQVNIRPRITPTPIDIRSVSVSTDSTIDVNFGPYPGGDFVNYEVYRSSAGSNYNLIAKVTDQLSTDFLDSSEGIDAEDEVYCYKILVENDCEVVSDINASDEHCTIEVSSTPGEDQITLNWNAYVGWPVAEYEIFRTIDYGLGGLISIGRVPGGTLTFVDDSTVCRDPITYRVMAISAGGINETSLSDITVDAPIHNPPSEGIDITNVTVVDDSYIQLNWEPYNGYRPLAFVLERSIFGANAWDTLITLPLNVLDLSDQEGINVKEESYQYRVHIIDECFDRTPEGRIGQSILLNATLPSGSNQPNLRWNPYEEWLNGVSSYEVEVLNEQTGNFELVEILPDGSVNYSDDLTNLFQSEYRYRIRAFEAGGNGSVSVSNEDSVVFPPKLFVPNAFSPNSDGKNDIFKIATPFMEFVELKIFDRWGRIVFRTLNPDDGWNGNQNNEFGRALPEGVYVYVISAIGEDQQSYNRTGTVTLIR